MDHAWGQSILMSETRSVTRCSSRDRRARDLVRRKRASVNASRHTHFFPQARDAMFAGWNDGHSIATAFHVTNFVLDAATRIGGIKLRTARGDSTPRSRVASTFPITRTTSRPSSSKRVKPSRLVIPPRGPHGFASPRKAASLARDTEVRDDPDAR